MIINTIISKVSSARIYDISVSKSCNSRYMQVRRHDDGSLVYKLGDMVPSNRFKPYDLAVTRILT